MFAEVAGLPRQLRDGYAAARDAARRRLLRHLPGDPAGRADGLVVCGMGGSAIGADLVLACLPELSGARDRRARVLARRRGSALRRWSSWSATRARPRRRSPAPRRRARAAAPPCASPRAVAWRRFAEAEGLPLVVVPGGGQPRAAVGSLSMPLLATLEASGLCGEHAATSRRPPPSSRTTTPSSVRTRRTRTIPPSRWPVGSRSGWSWCTAPGPPLPVARRWKGQINENAKAPAFFNELPELDHNEIMGWTSLPHVTSSTVALFLHDESGEERLTRRAELTAREYEGLGVATELVAARGDSRLARLFSLVQLGDYVSLLPRRCSTASTPRRSTPSRRSRRASPATPADAAMAGAAVALVLTAGRRGVPRRRRRPVPRRRRS